MIEHRVGDVRETSDKRRELSGTVRPVLGLKPYNNDSGDIHA